LARIAVRNKTRGTELGTRVRVADNPWTRFVGLLGASVLQQGDGLHIKPCSSVHMFFMRIPLDIVYLDAEHRVVKLVPGLRPWRISAARGAKSVLELPVGLIEFSGTRVGDELELDPVG
jgi:uncharacterized membrane protein (UPF0127 family)